MTYSQKLRDPRWQKKRLEIFERDGWKCFGCESKDKTLNVHHKYYVVGRDPWEYPDFCYVSLCDTCHRTAQDIYSSDLYQFEKFLAEREVAE